MVKVGKRKTHRA